MRNHYVTLGVMQDATPREVVYAYHHLARKLHPDLHPDDPDAAERFRDVHEAYEVLSDAAARQRHDAELTRIGVVPPGGMPGAQRAGGQPGRAGAARPASARPPRRASSPTHVAHTSPRRTARPLLRRPWWQPPLYGVLLFAGGSLIAIAAIGWRTYEDVRGVLAVVLFLGCAFYVLQSLWNGAVTRR